MKKARQNFARATEFTNDEYLCLYSWIAYGHSFAKDYEHDQALAAYIQAGQLMPFIHEPNLFIGMQHLSNKNYKLAEEYFQTAAEYSCQVVRNGTLSTASIIKSGDLIDPFVLSELGYTNYIQGNYQKAERYLKQAISTSGYKSVGQGHQGHQAVCQLNSSYKEGPIWPLS